MTSDEMSAIEAARREYGDGGFAEDFDEGFKKGIAYADKRAAESAGPWQDAEALHAWRKEFRKECKSGHPTGSQYCRWQHDRSGAAYEAKIKALHMECSEALGEKYEALAKVASLQETNAMLVGWVREAKEVRDDLGAKVARLEKTISELDSPYCQACGSCGEAGCCDARSCKYPGIKPEELTDLKGHNEELQAKAARLEAELAQAWGWKP